MRALGSGVAGYDLLYGRHATSSEVWRTTEREPKLAVDESRLAMMRRDKQPDIEAIELLDRLDAE